MITARAAFLGTSILAGLCLGLVGMRASTAKPAAAKAPIAPAGVDEILAAVRSPGAKAVLVNVWATWCDPCREEMPDLVRFYRDNKARGLRLVLVSGDARSEKAEAEKYLSSQGVDFRSFLKVGDDMTFIDRLNPRWSGTMPASFLYDGSGKQRHFWSGKVTYQSLRQKLDEVLGPHTKIEEKGRNP